MSASKTTISKSCERVTRSSNEDGTQPPPYEASAPHDQVPHYHNRPGIGTESHNSSDRTQLSGKLRSEAPARQHLRDTRRRSTSQLLGNEGVMRRIPPEHLCKTPKLLPAATSHSPFDDLRIQESARQPVTRRASMPAASQHRLLLVAGVRHGDYDVHRLHGLSDSRMHAQPALDEHGNPKRDVKSGSMLVGAAVGVLAVAACSIM